MRSAPRSRSAHARRGAGGGPVYRPRRPQASPRFRWVSEQLHRLELVHDERRAREDGPWRPVVAQVADKFLTCGVLEHGFARIRCDTAAVPIDQRHLRITGEPARVVEGVSRYDTPNAVLSPAGTLVFRKGEFTARLAIRDPGVEN